MCSVRFGASGAASPFLPLPGFSHLPCPTARDLVFHVLRNTERKKAGCHPTTKRLGFSVEDEKRFLMLKSCVKIPENGSFGCMGIVCF